MGTETAWCAGRAPVLQYRLGPNYPAVQRALEARLNVHSVNLVQALRRSNNHPSRFVNTPGPRATALVSDGIKMSMLRNSTAQSNTYPHSASLQHSALESIEKLNRMPFHDVHDLPEFKDWLVKTIEPLCVHRKRPHLPLPSLLDSS